MAADTPTPALTETAKVIVPRDPNAAIRARAESRAIDFGIDFDKHGGDAAIDALYRAMTAGAEAARALPVPVVPEGWRLVPIEPTPEMVEAACNWRGEVGPTTRTYAAMLDAAPSAPSAPPKDAQPAQPDVSALLEAFRRDAEKIVDRKSWLVERQDFELVIYGGHDDNFPIVARIPAHPFGNPSAEEMAQVMADSYCRMFPALALIRNTLRTICADRKDVPADAMAALLGMAYLAHSVLPVQTIGDAAQPATGEDTTYDRMVAEYQPEQREPTPYRPSDEPDGAASGEG